MRTTFTLLLLLFFSFSFAQNNLLDTNWPLGSGYVDGYGQYGGYTKNIRELGVNPYGETDILWKGIADTSNSQDGGPMGGPFNIDINKTYRFTVWMKKTGSNDGASYFGPTVQDESNQYSSIAIDGNANPSNFFMTSDLPELNKWYLIVGYVHPSTYTATSNLGAIYDGLTKEKVNSVTITDYKFSPTSKTILLRALLAGSNTSTDRQYYYAPTIYEVNNQEPSISEILNNGNVPPTNSGTSVWTQSGNNITYAGGNVGIGIANPMKKFHIFNDASYEAGYIESNQLGTNLRYRDNTGKKIEIGIQQGDAVIRTDSQVRLLVESGSGNIGIGTNNPDAKLAVNGNIHTKEVKVDLVGWPDFVFYKDYKLPTLEEVAQHIQEKGHLKDIPSAKEVAENGIFLGEMDAKLLQKIEELTLYTLEQQKLIEKLRVEQEKNKILEDRLAKIEALLSKTE